MQCLWTLLRAALSSTINTTSIPTTGLVFFFNAPSTTEIYTLSLHDALPISSQSGLQRQRHRWFLLNYFPALGREWLRPVRREDRKSTRLNSSHPSISYAVFCLKKKKILRT